MKKIFAVTVFACLLVVNTVVAGIQIGFPNGGEKLPINGRYQFYWTNSEPLLVAVYVDHYNEATNLDEEVKLFSFTEFFYIAGAGGANFPNIHDPVDLNTNGFYKVRLVGVSPEGVWFTNQSAGFFRITPPATIETVFNYTNTYWRQGEQKSMSVTWRGFDSGDRLDVYLYSAEQYMGEEYGFVYTNNVFPSESGTMTISLDYPTTNQTIGTNVPMALVDGMHSFAIKNTRTGIWYYFGTVGMVDMVVSDFRIRLRSPSQINQRNYVFPDGKIRALEIELDAQFAPTNVLISQLNLGLWSTTNILMDVDVRESSSNSLFQITIGDVVSGSKTNTVQLPFSGYVLSKGTSEMLYFDCMMKSNANFGTFMWTSGGTNTITATSSDGRPISIGIIGGYAGRVNVVPQQGATIYGISLSPEKNEVVLTAYCEAGIRYSVEKSVDLKTWTIVKYINSTMYTLQTTVPTSGDKGFFRILERPL